MESTKSEVSLSFNLKTDSRKITTQCSVRSHLPTQKSFSALQPEGFNPKKSLQRLGNKSLSNVSFFGMMHTVWTTVMLSAMSLKKWFPSSCTFDETEQENTPVQRSNPPQSHHRECFHEVSLCCQKNCNQIHQKEPNCQLIFQEMDAPTCHCFSFHASC